MLKRFLLFTTIAACSLSLQAQSDTLSAFKKSFKAQLLKPQTLSKWNIPAGNYSGITPLGNDHYAVVTDKPKGNGFYEFEIKLDSNGQIISAQNLGFHSDSLHTTLRDMEGIAYVPSTNTVFISAESDQQILEYTLDGQLTGHKLNVPAQFSAKNIQSNYGFEALAYSPVTHLFWTTTENMLTSDLPSQAEFGASSSQAEFGASSSQAEFGGLSLRLQSFTSNLQPSLQYAYLTDAPQKSRSSHRFYCFGVPEITALPDSSLLVMERELHVPTKYLGASVNIKIYRVFPNQSAPITFADSMQNISPDKYLKKTLLTEFRTPLSSLSNYEGMCLGPTLPDGTPTLLLICDSQDNSGNALYHLKDRIRVILLKQ